MYNPDTNWALQDAWNEGLLWILTRMPGGASGVRLNSNKPFRCACEDRRRLRHYGQRKLRVSRAWSRRWSQRCMGNLLSQMSSAVIRWFLKVRDSVQDSYEEKEF